MRLSRGESLTYLRQRVDAAMSQLLRLEAAEHLNYSQLDAHRIRIERLEDAVASLRRTLDARTAPIAERLNGAKILNVAADSFSVTDADTEPDE